jgi:hypothetical protein
MKLFFFNPNDYGAEYLVLSDSKENALMAVIKYLSEEASKEEPKYTSKKRQYDEWKDRAIDNLPEDYTIDVFDKDEVVETYYG